MSDLLKLTSLGIEQDDLLAKKPQKHKWRRGRLSIVLSFCLLFVLMLGFSIASPVKASDLVFKDYPYEPETGLSTGNNNPDGAEIVPPAFGKRVFTHRVEVPDVPVLDILVLEIVPNEPRWEEHYHYSDALNNLGLPHTLVTTQEAFADALVDGTSWDLVIHNSYNWYSTPAPTPETLNDLKLYVEGGGNLIFADWWMYQYPSHPLLTTLGIDFQYEFQTPRSFTADDPTHTMFTTPNSISVLNWSHNQWRRDGEIVSILPGATQLAEFNGGDVGEAAIVYNNSFGGRSIFNAFQAVNFNNDDDSDGKFDIVELIENQIEFLSNEPPVAGDDTYQIYNDKVLTVPAPGVLTNDNDPESQPITAVLDDNVDHGTLTLNPNGSFTYVPDMGYVGTDEFTYYANDGESSSDVPATVIITVDDGSPVLAPIGDKEVDEPNQLTFVVSASDPTGDPILLSASNLPDDATFSLTSPTTGIFVWNTDYNDAGVYPNVRFEVTEIEPTEDVRAPGDIDFEEITITVHNTNRAPIMTTAIPDIAGEEEVPIGFTVEATDPDGDDVFYTLEVDVDPPTSTPVINLTSGAFDWTPGPGDVGTYVFTFIATDNGVPNLRDIQEVTIVIGGTNSPPVLDFISDKQVNETQTVTINCSASDPDPGDELAYSVEDAPGGSIDPESGVFTWTTTYLDAGVYHVTFKVTDDGDPNLSDEQIVQITVTNVNRQPYGQVDDYTSDEDILLFVDAENGVLANDSDDDPDDILTAQLKKNVEHGTLRLFPDGSFAYQPNENWHGTDGFEYVAYDGELTSVTLQVTLTVNPVNDPPVAGNDAYDAVEDTKLTIAAPGVLANDNDPVEGDPITAVLDDDVDHGTLVLNPDGSFEYTPDANYNGTDQFTYYANDGTDNSLVPATVVLTIEPVNDAPVALDGGPAEVVEDGVYVRDFGQNDQLPQLVSDVDFGMPSETHTYSIAPDGGPEHGAIVWTNINTGTFTYTPSAHYTGPDQFTYRVTDAGGLFAEGTISFNVTPVNDPPVATGDHFDVEEDGSHTGDLTPLVTDVDFELEGDVHTYAIHPEGGDPEHGDLVINANGTYTYTPDENYNGEDEFAYIVTDKGGLTATATVTILVTPVDDAPVAVNDPGEGRIPVTEDTPLSVDVLDNDFDYDEPYGDEISLLSVSDPAHGTAIISEGEILYTPDENYFGPDQFTYMIQDDDGTPSASPATVLLTVNPVNDAPYFISPDHSNAIEDQFYSYTPEVEDIENDNITYSLEDAPDDMSIDPTTGTITWTPTEGPDVTVFIIATDDGAPPGPAIGTQEFTIDVAPVNDVPQINPIGNVTIDEDEELVKVPLTGIYGGDAELEETITITASSDNPGLIPHPTVIYTSANSTGTLSFSPVEDQNGSAIVTVTVTDDNETPGNPADDQSRTRTFIVTVNPVNDAPVVSDIPDQEINEGETFATVNLDDYVTDVDNDITTLSWNALVDGDLTVTITDRVATITIPSADWFGAARVSFVASDGDKTGSDEAVFIVNNVNDAPVVGNIPDQTVAEGETFVKINLDDYVTDIDNDDDEIAWSYSGNSELSVMIREGRVATVTIPHINWNGFETITFTANDGELEDSDFATFAVTPVNDAPVITSEPETEATEDVEYAYDPTAEDVEDDNLTWTLRVGPDGMTIDAASGAVRWTPPEGVTSVPVTVRVTDDGEPNLFDEQSFVIEVEQINDAPVITSEPVLEATEEIEYVYDPDVEDPDFGDEHVWTLLSGPDDMDIDEETGELTWTPEEGVTGAEVTIRVTDDGEPELFDEQSFTIAVIQVNDAPIITSTAPLFAEEDKEYTYFVQATDPDLPGDVLTFSLDVKPDGMTIDPASGAIRWTPANGVTSAEVTVRVTDDGTNPDNLFDTQSWTITVKPVNDAPVITSDAPTTAVEDEQYSYNPTAEDQDNTQTELSWTLLEKPDGMSINAATGAIIWTPDNEDAGGTFGVVLKVEDPDGASDVQEFSITVTPVNDAPVITSSAPTTAIEDEQYTYNPTAEDIDNTQAELMWSLAGAPAGMTCDPNSGEINWTPPNGVTSSGELTLTVSDGALTDEEVFTITVTPVNDAPRIISSAPTSATEDVLYTYNPVAEDQDNTLDELSWSLETSPEGMVINEETGAISWTPLNGVTAGGVIVKVTDPDGQFDMQKFVITVTPVNDAPVITSTPILTATEDEVYTYSLSATDEEDDDLTWNLEEAPAGMVIVSEEGDYIIFWTPPEGVTSANVTVRVTDDGDPNRFDEQTFTITVNQVNDAPEITSEPIITATEDVEYVYDVEAEDVDLPGDVLTFSLITKPDNMTIDPTTGVIRWTPLEGELSGGVHVRVVDNGNPQLQDDQFFTITVTPVNDAPEITSTPITVATEEVEYSYDADATDIEGDEMSWSLVKGPEGMKIDEESGVVTWTPEDGQHTADVVIRVDDDGTGPDDAHSLQEFIITVTPVNDDPTIDEPEDMELTEDDPEQTVTLTGINDGDLNDDQILTLTAISSHPDRIHNPEIFYVQGEEEATLTFTPDPDANGVVTITVNVVDDQGGSASTEFNVDIHPVNDAPVLDEITSPAPVLEDADQQVITLTGIDDGDPEIVQDLTITATSSDINIVHNPVVDLEAGTLTYTPVPDASGTVIITVTIEDDGLIPDIYNPPDGTLEDEQQSTVYTFEIQVLPVNDAPFIDQVPDQTVAEDDPDQQVVDLTGIEDGDPDLVQNLTVTAESSDEEILTNISVVYNPSEETGTLLYNVVENAFGTASITVTVTDDGGTDNGGVNETEMTFNVEITPSSDAPVVLPIEDQTAYVGQELTFTVGTSDPDGDVPTIAEPENLPEGATFVDNGDGTGTFTWTPTLEQIGEHTVTFIANDGEFDSEPVDVTITVEEMNSIITVTGLDETAHVYLFATSGWFGKHVFDGNSSVDVVAGHYLLCVRQEGMRTEFIPVTAPVDDEIIVDVSLYASVPVLCDTKLALTDNVGDPINVGDFSSASMDDMDKDGDKDLVVITEDGVVSIYMNNGTALELDATFTLELEGGFLACMRLVDLNENNKTDILYGLTDGQIKVYDSEDTDQIFYTAPDGLTGFDLVDVNSDHASDLILGFGDGSVDIDESDGAGGWVGPLPVANASDEDISVGANAAPLGLDINGDGSLDLVVGNEAGTAQWFQNDGSGAFALKGFVNAGGEALAVSGNAALSLSYGDVGGLPEAVVTDEDGNVFTSDVVLQGDISGITGDRDGTVDVFDLNSFGRNWGKISEDEDWEAIVNLFFSGDVGSVQSIDIFDLNVFGRSWGLTLK